MFYGKHFQSMYEGSMVGAGAGVFAVMGYVIAHQERDVLVGAQVDLNPKLLAFVIGEKEEVIEKAIRYLCAPDPDSRSKAEQGRRLIKIGTFSYKVVNGAKYLAIRDAEKRREQNREAQRTFRAKGKPLAGEEEVLRKVESGEWTQEQADDYASETREKGGK